MPLEQAEGRAFQDRSGTPRRASPSALLALVGFVGLPVLSGLVAGGITATSVRTWYAALAAPPGTPPNWLFAPVWTVLYVLMGVAAWLVWRDVLLPPARRYAALRLWGWQLGLNALWTPAFFGMHSTLLGLVVILPLLVLVGTTATAFWRLRWVAGLLLLPYFAWTAYAAYLNTGFWWLNRG